MVDDREVELVAEACRALGEPAGFEAPPGYPDSLALCILDSVWSLGVKYKSVVNVVCRWREYAKEHIDPEVASASDLIETIDEAGGPQGFADAVVCNHQRTSTKNGILKADAVYQCAKALHGVGVNTTSDLRARIENKSHEEVAPVKQAWRGVRGQASSTIGWHYLLILANVEDVKADRMLVRFVERAIDRTTDSPEEVRDLVLAAHKLLVNSDGSPSIRALDHEIWSRQRGR